MFQKWILIVVSGAMFVGTAVMAQPRPAKPIEVPDLTKNPEIDKARTYNLGATGMRGWIFTKPQTNLDASQGRTTALSRQILVTHVGDKSPADGVMQVGDVIVGLGGKMFDDDARKQIAYAIQRAESKAAKGDLHLTVWRDGKTQDVHLHLRTMGDYDANKPLESEKARLILDEACQALAKEGISDGWAGPINGLAMLASGKEEFMPVVRDRARAIAQKTIEQNRKDPERGTWELSYRAIFLCEYYLLTKDKEVYPAVEELTIDMAKGQGMFGTVSHRLVDPLPDGTLHGPVPAYGPVNNTGLAVNVAILFGSKCGVNHPEVKPAIERASKFFSTYVDMGAIPYGEHEAYPTHDNNGKNAMSAVFFSLQDDRVSAAKYFAKMVTASYRNREYGHTGQGFCYLWGALGANCGGPAALSAFINQASWHFDLVRRCDGSFTYDGGEQYGGGSTHDNTYYGKSDYYGLSPNATYVLTYSLPLHKLLITGREAQRAQAGKTPAYWLNEADAKEATASGRFDLDRKNCTVQQLVTALGDWSPVARTWAAEELATRQLPQQLMPELLRMAGGENVRQRLGACDVLGRIKDPQAIPLLAKLLSHPDRLVRSKSAEALQTMGPVARPALPQILQAIIGGQRKAGDIDWEDPAQITQLHLSNLAFNVLLRDKTDDVDSKLLFDAMRAALTNANGGTRGQLARLIQRTLTVDQIRELGPDLMTAIYEMAPADQMFGNGIREAGVQALAKYHFEEGIDACLLYARTQSKHSSQDRMKLIMKTLASYGTAAQRLLPELNKLVEECKVEEGFPEWARKVKAQAVVDGIKEIEAAKDQPTLIRLAEKQKLPK